MVRLSNNKRLRREYKMADVQKYFEQFHRDIRVDYDLSSTLREKRDIILERIRKYLKKNNLPLFDQILQGSYTMKTGVKPIADLEYDIDVGLRFSFNEKERSAKEVRKWIFDAVDGHTESVNDKGPCARVTYADGYHVDLVSYAVWENSAKQDEFRLAHKNNGWRPADPQALLEHVQKVMSQYDGTEDSATSTNQFRRVVRYLRRWIDEAMPYESNSKPIGLAFVLLAERYLQPSVDWDGKSNDRVGLYNMATSVSNIIGRVVINKPTPEYEDVFAKLSDDDIDDFKDRLRELAADLSSVEKEPDPVKACELLRSHFGADFPVPTPDATAKKTAAPAIVSSSSSA
jgi:hypothetical protein